jgi:hypothetical protein
MKIVYQVSRDDYLGAVRLFFANQKHWYRRALRLILPWMGGTLLLMEIVSEVVVPHRDLLTVVAGSLIGLYFIYCGFAVRLYFRRACEKNRVYQHDFSADISEDGIHIVTATSETQYKWASFIRYLESGRFFMLYVTDLNFITFPKRAFSPRDIEHFQELLRRHISVAS